MKASELTFEKVFPMIVPPETNGMNPVGITILKVKDWCVKFSYRGHKFLLHDSSCDGECSIILYEFTSDENGRYNLKAICTVYGIFDRYLFDSRTQFGATYKQMDKEYFEQYLKLHCLSDRIEAYCNESEEK